ncbi:MAG: M23 family metallopeptidase [Oscillospiraceae bacterium]|nr:M23 family metallopeptidase [Oscillospiraceae bacterium]
MFKNPFTILLVAIVVLLILISCLFIPILANSNSNANINFIISSQPASPPKIETITLTSNFEWPAPGYKTITCGFGYRVAPATGASTYHGGIDIAAPTGAKLIATFSGKVIFTGFAGANGYEILIENGDFTATYGHVSPNYIVKKNQYVAKGEVIRQSRSF